MIRMINEHRESVFMNEFPNSVLCNHKETQRGSLVKVDRKLKESSEEEIGG